MNALTSFITLMLAISIASERMVEVLKGLFTTSWLFSPQTDAAKEARRCAWMHVLAGVCGGIVAAVGRIDVFKYVGGGWPHSGYWQYLYYAASCGATGALASGGSAFWNHILDFVQASKVQQEQAANAVVSATQAKGLINQ